MTLIKTVMEHYIGTYGPLSLCFFIKHLFTFILNYSWFILPTVTWRVHANFSEHGENVQTPSVHGENTQTKHAHRKNIGTHAHRENIGRKHKFHLSTAGICTFHPCMGRTCYLHRPTGRTCKLNKHSRIRIKSMFLGLHM